MISLCKCIYYNRLIPCFSSELDQAQEQLMDSEGKLDTVRKVGIFFPKFCLPTALYTVAFDADMMCFTLM